MKERFLRIAKWAVYPIVYFLCLGLFGYIAFPLDRIKDRIIAEFEQSQRKKNGTGPRLQIDRLDSYWLSGVLLSGVKLTMPPSEEPGPSRSSSSFDLGGADKDAGPKETTIELDEVTARVKLLPLLAGRVRIAFSASAFDGRIDGTIPVGSGDVELSLEDIDLSQVGPLGQTLGVPLQGKAKGTLNLSANEGKFSKASGSLDLALSEVSVGDGKTKIKGLLALPEAKVGEIVVTAEAREGALKVTKLSAVGGDIELAGDGKASIREPWNESNLDLYVRFKFSDAYRDKSDVTKSLLGSPGSKAPALLESDAKVRQSKRSDGFYGWHVHGALKRLRFDPTTSDGPGGRRTKTEAPSPKPPRPPRPEPDEETAPVPPTPPPPTPMPEPEPMAPMPVPDAPAQDDTPE